MKYIISNGAKSSGVYDPSEHRRLLVRRSIMLDGRNKNAVTSFKYRDW
jgi:hypothetical protein